MSVLSEALLHKLIPWSQQDATNRLIMARKKMSAAQMPDGVRLSRSPIVGPREVVKDRRLYGNVRGIRAQWPEAHLGEWEQFKLICVLDGRIDFQLNRYAVECSAGFFLVAPPGTIQPMLKSCHARGYSCDVLHVILQPQAVQCFIAHGEEGQRKMLVRENYLFSGAGLIRLLQAFQEEILSGRKDAIPLAAGLLASFWKMLERDVNEEHYINPGPLRRPVRDREKKDGFEAELLHYIQTHLNSRLTLEEVAHGLFLSRTHFVRKVRRETGKSFVQFLTDYRIAEAKALLRDSDWSITAIAGFLGFNSVSYFQRLFRRHTGQTPGEYRARV